MYTYQRHYYDIVQRDLILSENLSTIHNVPKLEKINIALGGSSSDENYVVSAAAALNIISGQKSFFTHRKKVLNGISNPKEIVGSKLTIRGSKIYNFLYKILSSASFCTNYLVKKLLIQV